MTSNCLIFALRRVWRSGGYLILRRSSYGWWPHVIWSPDLVRFEEFTTADKFSRWCPPILFPGFIQSWVPGVQLAVHGRVGAILHLGPHVEDPA
jgi:hypothetical protein